MTDETITEQLAEIDRDMADIERQVAELVEESQQADYPQPEPQPVQVCEGRWRTRNGLVRDVTAMPTNHEDFAAAYPWWDGVSTWRNDGRWLAGGSTMDLLEYLGPIEQQPQPQPEPVPEPNAATIDELRSEVSYVQRLLGESRQRVTQLEELVASLRTINEATEKAVEAAGKENTALRNQLAAVKAELANVAGDRYRLQIELDAAQQVPADSPELRQLRLDLAEVTQDRDTYRHAHELLVQDVNATHQRTKVMTIEAIVEWLVPIRTCGSQALATAVISNLPHIMRSLAGLEDEGIE